MSFIPKKVELARFCFDLKKENFRYSEKHHFGVKNHFSKIPSFFLGIF